MGLSSLRRHRRGGKEQPQEGATSQPQVSPPEPATSPQEPTTQPEAPKAKRRKGE